MATKQQKGEFLLRFAISAEAKKRTPQGLVLYENVVCIQTFIEKANCINFITSECLSTVPSTPKEYLYKRGYISKVIDQLPESFIQISQSTIVNLNHLTGRSAHSLELGNSLQLSIGAKQKKYVENAILEWLTI